MDFYDMGTSVEKVLLSINTAKYDPEFKHVVEELEDELNVISDILHLIHPVPGLSAEVRLGEIEKIRRKQLIKRMDEELE